MAQRALVLFSHGARDKRWAEPFQRLQQLTQEQLPDVEVVLAFLELMSPTLQESVDHLITEGCHDFTIVPVFLGQGGHVRRDLPLLVTQLQAAHPQARFKVVNAVGESPEILSAMARYCIGSLGGE